MPSTEKVDKTDSQRPKKGLGLLILLLGFAGILFSGLLSLQFFQRGLVKVAERFIAHRSLNTDYWISVLTPLGHWLLLIFSLIFLVSLIVRFKSFIFQCLSYIGSVILKLKSVLFQFARHIGLGLIKISRVPITKIQAFRQLFSKQAPSIVSAAKVKPWFFVLLGIAPLVILTAAISLHSVRGPYYQNLDPEYAYLFNSLLVSEGKVPQHIDHPGTTLQLLGAAEIAGTNLGKSREEMRTTVLKNSEEYITLTNMVLVALALGCTFLMGFVILKITGRLWLSLLLQFWVLYSPFLFSELGYARPDTLLLSVSLLFTLLIVSLFRYDITKHVWFYVIAFSLLFGFAIATKIVFFPMFLIPLFLVPKLRYKALLILGTILAFVIFTLPMASRYTDFLRWLSNLSSHSGIYGSGPAEILNLNAVIHNLQNIFMDHLAFSLVFLGSGIFILFCLISPKHRKIFFVSFNFRIFLVIFIAELAQVFIASRNYFPRYLVPTLMLTGLNLAFLILCIQTLIGPTTIKKLRVPVGVAIALLGIYNINTNLSVLQSSKAVADVTAAINRQVEDHYKNYTEIDYYVSSTHAYGLNFGNDFAGREYSATLQKLYPESYFYNVWERKYYSFSGQVEINQIMAKNNNILYRGSSFEKFYTPEFRTDVPLKGILNTPGLETLYTIDLPEKPVQ